MISRGSLDKSLVEFKLASNSKLKRNLEKQVEVYKAASDAHNALKVILFFTQEQEAKVSASLRSLGLENNRDIFLIDGRADNKPSGSAA
jgi:membrane carboxypeptidase/penicillin-binding protein PbpC